MADVIYSGGATDEQIVVGTSNGAERGVKTFAVSGDIVYSGGATDTQVVVQTAGGAERAQKVFILNSGGGGGGGTSDYTDLDNKPQINSVTLSGNKSSADLHLQGATNIVTLTTSSTELATNTIYNGGELASVTFTLPATVPADFVAQLNFTSGTTATTFTAPATVTFEGDACSNGVFTPLASKRYSVLIYTDGVNVIGLVMGN